MCATWDFDGQLSQRNPHHSLLCRALRTPDFVVNNGPRSTQDAWEDPCRGDAGAEALPGGLGGEGLWFNTVRRGLWAGPFG